MGEVNKQFRILKAKKAKYGFEARISDVNSFIEISHAMQEMQLHNRETNFWELDLNMGHRLVRFYCNDDELAASFEKAYCQNWSK